MQNQNLKTFTWRVDTEEDVNLLSDFHNVAVYSGKVPRDVLRSMMKDFVKKNRPSRITLVTEKALVEKSREQGLIASQGTIKKYRRNGWLKDASGQFWVANSEGKIVYIWEKMKKFLQIRHDNPYSRIKNG